ncbi:SpoIIE family protein phosphatase [Persicobacter sp. CCB-QB2]|uniref:SpoIIE family protein phosphatase n=1 Tax=Persicobacter sp. CCB-QB2 TaxID=1561025 RepID=UPI0006A9A4B6|nr:SpoIIE family protein phosphatase [Persicobacter sp. CCB-QB2]
MYLFSFLLCLLLWIATPAMAQRVHFDILKEYGPGADYSGSAENRDIAQNDQGYLFFANAEGVLRYDGSFWTLINNGIPQPIRSVGASVEHREVFYGGMGTLGKLRYQPEKGFQLVSLVEELPDSLRDFKDVRQCLVHRGEVYFNTEKYLLIRALDAPQWRAIAIQKKIKRVFLFGDHLILRSARHFHYYFKGRERLFKRGAFFSDKRIAAIFPVNEERWIIAGQMGPNDHIWDYFPQSGERQLWKGSRRLGVLEGGALLNKDQIIFFSKRRGLLYFNLQGQLLRALGRKEGLSSGRIADLYNDPQGISWVVHAKGVSQVRNNGRTFFVFPEGGQFQGMVTTLFRYSPDTVYFGTQEQFGRILEGADNMAPKIEILNRKMGEVLQFQWSQQMGLLILTEEGLFNWSEELGLLPFLLNRTEVLSFHIFRKWQKEWLLIARRENFEIYELSNAGPQRWWFSGGWPGIPNRIIPAAHQGEFLYQLWVGHRNADLGFLQLKFIAPDSLKVHSRFFSRQKQTAGFDLILSQMVGEDLFIRDKALWKYDYRKQEFEYLKSFPKTIRVYPVDRGDRKVVLNSFDREEEEFWMSQWDSEQQRFLKSDWSMAGLSFGKMTSGVPKGKQGYFWMGGSFGLFGLHTSIFNISLQERQPQFLNMEYLNSGRSEVLSGEDYYSFQMPYDSLPIRLNYGVVGDNTMPHKYRYRIAGHSSWSDWSYKTQMIIENLFEGEYEIEIEAMNIFGEVGPTNNRSLLIQPPVYRQWYAYLIYVMLVGGLFIAGGKWFSYRFKRENSILEEKVALRTSAILRKNELLKKQTEHLELQAKAIRLQNQQMERDLKYGARLQRASLPKAKELLRYVDRYFVLFRPKTKVGGDFYLVMPYGDQQFILAAGDCTGHGVPGALVSSIANVLIRETIKLKAVSEPKEVMEIVDQEFTRLMKNDNPFLQEGLELALCFIDPKERKVKFSGAKRPLWVLENGVLHKYKGARRSIGEVFLRKDIPFSQCEFQYAAATSFFLFSDGLTDQFGGPDNRKFGQKRLEELILNTKPQFLEATPFIQAFEEWKGQEDQVDDVLLISFTLK